MLYHRVATFSRPDTPRRPSVFLRTLFVLALSLHACAAGASAQDLPDDSDEVVRVRTDLVTIPLFVTDERGRRFPGLGRDDFAIHDDGRRVETTYFAAGAERVALLFLLDASGSTRDVIARQRATALAIFSHFGARSRVAVMPFSEKPELTLPFTGDVSAAQPAFQISARRDSRTAIFDAALAAVRAFRTGDQHPAERRIVVLISDGLDTASTERAGVVVNEAKESGVSFYVIHLPLYEPRGHRLAPRRPAKGFRELAEKTGGQFFLVGDARAALNPNVEYDLRPVFQAIADDLLGQYVLGYYAGESGQSAGAHRVEVRLNPAVGRKLRVRQLREVYELKAGGK